MENETDLEDKSSKSEHSSQEACGFEQESAKMSQKVDCEAKNKASEETDEK